MENTFDIYSQISVDDILTNDQLRKILSVDHEVEWEKVILQIHLF